VDQSNNTSQATATVTVLDTTRPVVSVQNLKVYLDASGNGSITAAQVNNGSSDNCHIAKISLDDSLFNCSNLGSNNTVKLTAVDESGNTNHAYATVTVLDTTRPVMATQNLTVYLNASGNASITASQVNNGSSDNCHISKISLDDSLFNCSNLGSNNVVKLTAVDESGNTNHAYSTITVYDTTRPVMAVQNLTVYLDATGKTSITASRVNHGSSDNCHIAKISLDDSLFNCSNLGNNTVKLTAVDESGNTNHAYATILVKDTTRPVVKTQNVLITLNSSNLAYTTASAVNNGTTDNCSIISYSLSKTTFDCSNVGNNIVTLSVTDESGNVGTATAVVTVKDPTPPVARAKNITVYLDKTGNVTVAGKAVDNGSTDNCSVVSYTVSPATYSCSNTGWNKATLTVADAWGNTNAATCYIDVLDTIRPVAKAKNVTVYLDATGRATLNANQMDNGSYDNCAFLLAFDHDGDEWTEPNRDDLYRHFDCDDIGTHQVTLFAIDKSYNFGYATATVTVLDTMKPVIRLKNIVVNLGTDNDNWWWGDDDDDDNGGNSSTITEAMLDNGSYDNCGINSVSMSQSTFSCANIGTNKVTVTMKDASGNTSTATAIVTVEDNTAPDVKTKNITVALNASGSATIATTNIDNGSSDNCGIASEKLSASSFSCSNLGKNTVTLTITDASGNTSSADATVTVVDNIAPVARAKNATVYLDANGNASIAASQLDNGSSDNCGYVMAFDHDGDEWTNPNADEKTMNFTCRNIGSNNVTVYAIDKSNNYSAASVVVTVIDNIAPVVKTKNITVNLGANGSVVVPAASVDGGSYDNCSIASESLSQSTFTCANIGNTTVKLTVTDPAGNSSMGTAVITVKDATAPVVKTKNVTVYLDGSGNASVTAAMIDNGSTDNCSIASESLSKTSFTCANTGNNNVTLTVTDASGNSASANAVVTVIDNSSPVVKTKNITVYLDKNGNASVTPSQIDGGSYDNCSVSLSFGNDKHCGPGNKQINYNCSDIGTLQVTLIGTDPSGNSSTANASVTVKDTTKPVMVPNNLTVTLNNKGQASIKVSDVDNGSYDNCSIVNETIDISSFTCANLGANTVTLTATDASGNKATAKAIVTVNTTLSASAGKGQTVYYGYTAAYNTAGLSASASGGSGSNYSYKWSTGASTQSISVAPSTTTTYTVTVTDGNGCTASATVQVQVIDVRCNQNGGSVLVCLKGTTYCLPVSDVAAYLKKGATLGSCDEDAPISENQADLYGITLGAYPNPFSLHTTINFTVSTSNTVTLELYNLKGEKVSTLFNGNAEMNNIYTVDLNPAFMEPGVYMIRLTTPENVKYMKLVKIE